VISAGESVNQAPRPPFREADSSVRASQTPK
jgi:hypothetical protein